MLIYKPTGECFANRKEAKKALGHYVYDKALKNRQITLHESTDVII